MEESPAGAPRESPEPASVASEPPASSRALEVALLAILGFLPAIVAGFVYDDLLLIRDNRYAHGFGQLGRAFSTFFWQLGPTGSGGLHYYRPLITTSYIVDWVVSNGKPWFFHFENLVAHGIATGLVVKLAERWTARRLVAIAIGILFAFHPSRTESVIWIAGRTDVYMTVFLLLAVEAAFRSAARGWQGVALAASPMCFLLALLCKEAAVMLPVLLIPDLLLAAPEMRARLRRNLAVAVGIAAVFTMLRVFVFPVRLVRLEFTPTYGLMTVGAYLERVVLPWPQTFFHRPLVFEGGRYVYPLPLVVLGALVIVVYGAIALLAFRRDRAAGVLLVAAAVAFGPLLNFTYTGIFVTTSDHFLYLPLALFLLGIGRLHGAALERLAHERRARLAFFGLVGIYGAIDELRSFDYRDQVSIYQHELAENPKNPLVLKSLSEERARDGEIDEAFSLLLASTRPDAMKYRLLMPEWLAYQSYFRLLALQAARTADGNVDDVRAIYREFLSLLDGGRNPVPARVGELALGARLPPEQHRLALEQGGREILAAEAAFVATRLGDDGSARRLLDSLGPDASDYLPNIQNVCLAYARIGDYAGARRWLSVMQTRLRARFPEHSLDALVARLDGAEGLFARSRATSNEAEQRRLRSEAFSGLGAYLRALRELRPVIESGANVGPVGPFYVHLLVAAGLDEEAFQVASAAIGGEEAEALVKRTRAGLSPHMKKLRRPAGPSDWKTADPPGGGAP